MKEENSWPPNSHNMTSPLTATTSNLLESCEPIFVEYSLIREFNLLSAQEIPNVYVIPAASTPYKWLGVMFIHDGLYQGAILKFTLVIPAKFFHANSPDANERPRLFFDPIPFHPLVHPQTGELNTLKSIPKWRMNVNHLWQVILYAKQIFYNLDILTEMDADPMGPGSGSGHGSGPGTRSLSPPEDIADKLARGSNSLDVLFFTNSIRMLRHDFSGFQLKVEETRAECHARQFDNPSLWDNDQHAFQFGPWNTQQYDGLRRSLRAGRSPLSTGTGPGPGNGANNPGKSEGGDPLTVNGRSSSSELGTGNVGLSWVGSDGKSFAKPAN